MKKHVGAHSLILLILLLLFLCLTSCTAKLPNSPDGKDGTPLAPTEQGTAPPNETPTEENNTPPSEPLPEKSDYPTGRAHIKSIAHRGLSEKAPENTLAAFRAAKQQGFMYVECDVSFTADGVAVLLHDKSVDRTSNGTGLVSEMTYAELCELDFGIWFDPLYKGERIPSLSEFMLLCKQLGLHPYIELKTGTQEQIRSATETVRRYGMKENVTFISFRTDLLDAVRQEMPDVRLGLVVEAITESTLQKVTTILQTPENSVFIDCAYQNATKEAVLLCAAADIPLEVWTVNEESTVFKLDPYISGVTSNWLQADILLYNNAIADLEEDN